MLREGGKLRGTLANQKHIEGGGYVGCDWLETDHKKATPHHLAFFQLFYAGVRVHERHGTGVRNGTASHYFDISPHQKKEAGDGMMGFIGWDLGPFAV